MAPVTRGFRITLIASLIGMGAMSGARPALAQHTAPAPTLGQWQGCITEASRRFGLPAAWIRAVMRAESDGDPRALSPKGAKGLLQIMPATWAELRTRYGFGTDPYDPHDNILAGTAYLRELYDRYGYPDLFAAYNAGPQRLDAHLFGKKLPDETLAYLARLGQPVFTPPRPPVAASGRRLFFVLHSVTGTASEQPKESADGLFIPLNTVPDRKP